ANFGHECFLLFVALNKTTVARYEADRRGIQPIILARCPNLPDHFTLVTRGTLAPHCRQPIAKRLCETTAREGQATQGSSYRSR
ncbi:hypothetical protein LCGC14_2210390, partial [marine sediment metagenome]